MNHQENNNTNGCLRHLKISSFAELKEVWQYRDLLMLFVKRRGDGIQTNGFRTAGI
jgi:hypothetical protein